MNEKNIIIEKYLKDEISYPKYLTKKLKVLILCNPCHGFGDVIFALKLSKYLRKWYGCKIKIATTTPDSFISVGADVKDIILLETVRIKQCRRFSNVSPKKPIGKFDLYFVAPLPADNEILYRDISKLTPYSNRNNTFFFSEYNDELDKGFDFNTGIGKGRDGIFLVDIVSKRNTFKKKLGNYAVAYLAESIDKAEDCFFSFLKLITKKYKYKKFSVVTPKWIEELDFSRYVDKKNYGKIVVHSKDNSKDYEDEEIIINPLNTNELHIRCDILPLKNKDMLTLMKYSVDDILLTGDQSITDALSCCPRKNIFYQIAPWKENFGKNLAKLLPNPYLSRKRTSCGTIKAINYKSDYREFIKNWDFRQRGKAKLDAVMAYAIDYL